jgi:signal transduction histidine kinase
MFEDRSVGCVLMAGDGRIMSVTRSFAKMVGLPARLLFGQSILGVLTRTDNGKAVGLLVEGTATAIARNERSFFWTAYKIARGAALGGYYVGLLRDEEQANGLELRLAHRDRLATLGGLTAAMAHEIAGHVNVIANNAELLLNDGVDEETRQSLAVMREEAHRLGVLLHDILGMARDTPVNIKAQDTVKLLEKTVRLLHHQRSDKNVSMRIEADPNLPPAAGDAERLLQVFLNIVKNARDASPEGGEIVISVTTGTLQQDESAIEIRITDQGSGIAPSHLPKIFEPFFSTKSLEKGTGLGLSIARRIMTAHRGDLKLTSLPGKGTCAVVQIPVFAITDE